MSPGHALEGRRVLVVGLARSGAAAAEALVGQGAAVLGFDRNDALDAEGSASSASKCTWDARRRSCSGDRSRREEPGRARRDDAGRGRTGAAHPRLERDRARRPPAREPLLGVTGTNGKTTTSELLGAVFRAAGKPVEVAGNVGRPLSGLVGAVAPDAWIVCELSSFQLEDVETLRPRIAVLLNLEPDHLDRHGTFEWYADAKLRIFEAQTEDDTAVVPRGFGDVPGWARRVEFRFDDPLPRSRSSPARTTARTRQRPPPRLAPPGSTTTRSRALRTFPGVPPDRAGAGAPAVLRQRLEGDERRRSPPRARVLSGLTPARDPRRPWEGESVRAARRSPRRPRVRDRRVGGRDRRGAGRRRRALRAGGRPRRRARRVGRRAAIGMSCSSRPPARASISSATSRSAATRSGGSSGSSVRSQGQFDQRLLALVTLALVVVRARHGVQRDVRVRRARRRRPMSYLKRQAVYALIGVVAMTALARFDYRLGTSPCRSSSSCSGSVSPSSSSPRDQRRTPLVPARPASFQPSELASSRSASSPRLPRPPPAPAHVRPARPPARPRDGHLLRAHPARARPGDDDLALPDDARDPARRGGARAPARGRGAPGGGRRDDRHLGGAVPARGSSASSILGATRRAPASRSCRR